MGATLPLIHPVGLVVVHRQQPDPQIPEWPSLRLRHP
jgi:hypothetical protein